jgi:hypothetical protein
LVQAARREGVVFGRLQQHVAVLVVTQFIASLADGSSSKPSVLVKGGAALEMRRGISASQTSKDLDAVTREDLRILHVRLADAARSGWVGFIGVVTPPAEIDVPGLTVKPARFVVKLHYQGQPFASVPFEVSPVEAGNADEFDLAKSSALSLLGLPDARPVPCMFCLGRSHRRFTRSRRPRARAAGTTGRMTSSISSFWSQ